MTILAALLLGLGVGFVAGAWGSGWAMAERAKKKGRFSEYMDIIR